MPLEVELVLRRSGDLERRVLLASGVTRLGRAEDNDVVLPDIGVSRRHARILVDEERVLLEDLGSGNGTYFQGQRIEKQQLGDGDVVIIDPFVLSFHLRPQMSGQSLVSGVMPDASVQEPDMAPARLLVLNGHRLASAYPMGSGQLALGRADNKDVVLYDPSASRSHAVIRLRGLRYWVEDAGSANGTFLNGRRVREYPLSQGDRLRIGSTEFQFELLGNGNEVLGSISVPSMATAVRPVAGEAQTRPAGGVPAVEFSGRSSWVSNALAGMAVAFMVVVVVVVTVAAWRLMREPMDARTAMVVDDSAIVLPGPHAVEIELLMSQGRLLFYEGRYLDAAAQFYKVLKLEPDHIEATRLGFLACEFIGFHRLKEDILAQSTPQREGRRKYRDALKQVKQALAGKVRLSLARGFLEEVEALFPGDPEIRLAVAKIRKATADAAAEPESRQLREQVSALYHQGVEALNAQRYPVAIAFFEKVQAADPERRTHFWYEAREGLEEVNTTQGSGQP